MSESYGHAYLTAYGWSGLGTGLRDGAINRPLAIPPKKNLCGLGKDRDDAFPFWDHLFTAASKAIAIKVSSDDEDTNDTEDPSSCTDPGSMPLQRTTTGIISNRRPISGTPASTSGSTTPNPNIDANAPGPLSLLATAKREAAKHGLYARFFRGPVLGPDDDPCVDTISPLAPSAYESSSISAPHVGDQDDIMSETKKGRNQESEDKADTQEEQRECKRLKKERRAAKAAKRAEKALARRRTKERKDRVDDVSRKARKRRDSETRPVDDETLLHSEKTRKRAPKSVPGLEGDDLGPAKCARKRLEEELAPTNIEQQDTSHRPPSSAYGTGAFNVVLTTKKKKRKRKDTPS